MGGVDAKAAHRQHVNTCSLGYIPMNTPCTISENPALNSAPAIPTIETTEATASALSPTLATWASNGLAVAHLSLVGATGLTRMIASTHATITSMPLPWKADQVEHADNAPLPYKLVTQGLEWLEDLNQRLLHMLPAEAQSSGLFRSIINGVLGDSLVDHDNPLHQAMSLRNEFGEEITAAEWSATGNRGLVLFLHGLCFSEREWQNFSHQGFVRELRELGYGVAWLRYNSGRAIAENGADLSRLLEQLEANDKPITLIGHSMGGLLIRAATHYAEDFASHAENQDENQSADTDARPQKSAWLPRLKNAAYIGSPHQGAPLERLGESVNRLLALTPYTRPLMQLGDIRSTGIQDLRHGRITPSGKKASLQMPDHARHLLIAAHMGRSERRHWMGDGLVPVRSALGQHLDTDKILQGDITRVEFSGMGHTAMLSDERVYAALLEWLKP